MNFSGISLSTAILIGAGCAALLAVLHILRVRPRKVRVITTLFWKHMIERTQARSFFERFRHPLTYALLLLIVLLLVAALTEPSAKQGRNDDDRSVIVLDGGARMGAMSGGGRHFDMACEVVYDLAERLQAGGGVAVLWCGDGVRRVHYFDEPAVLLKRKLEQLSPTTGAGDVAEAVATGRQLIGREGTVYVVTNQAYGLAEEEGVEVVGVGEGGDNAGIISAVYEPDTVNGLRGKLWVKIGYWGEQVEELRVTIARGGGAMLYNETVEAEPGEKVVVTVDDLRSDGDELHITLQGDDSWVEDNQFKMRLPLRQPLRVWKDASLPAALTAGLDSAADVIWVDTMEDASLLVVKDRQGLAADIPAIVLVERGPQIPAGVMVADTEDMNWTQGLNFEGGVAGPGSVLRYRKGLGKGKKRGFMVSEPICGALDRDAVFLLQAGEGNLAAWQDGTDERARRLYLADALLSDQATAARRGAFVLFLSRAVQQLMGWTGELVTVPVERVNTDPLWWAQQEDGGDVAVLTGSEKLSNLEAGAWEQASGGMPAIAGKGMLPGFVWLLLGALVLMLLEAYLHIRGRIT